MLTKVRYSPKDLILWTRWEILAFFLFALVLAVLYDLVRWKFLELPWAPVALIGTAVAFIVGFQNNATYGRIWEARKIWGGIVNASRSWGFKVQDMVRADHATEEVSEAEMGAHRRALIYRHVAWLTALRHAMRQPRKWEVFERHRTNREWSAEIHIPEKVFSLEDDLFHYLSADEWDQVLDKTNKATALIFLQSKHLRELEERGLVWEFAFLELENVLEELVALQGKSERIKNFPYPRQYASLSYQFLWIFLIFLPFAAIPQFATVGERLSADWPLLGHIMPWLGVAFSVVVSWIFYIMERIGRVGENPFEGSANDVPISTISRGIEIDLREMLGEDKDLIPRQFPEVYDVQM